MKKLSVCFLFFVSLVLYFSSTADGALPGKYILTFHACDQSSKDCSQTTNHKIYLAYSDDGLSWTPLPNFTPLQGSVPDIVKRGDTLYIYSPDPDKVTRYNISTGNTVSANITVTKSDGSKDDFGDVSAYLDPSSNKIVIFYKSTSGFSGDPQNCTTCYYRSATEVDGSDGSEFLMDDGDRVTDQLQDNDIFYDGSKYILYFGKNSKGPGEKSKVLVYTSSSLKGTYTPLSTLPNGVLTESGSVPAGYYDTATGKYWTYITVLSPTEPAVIKRAVHDDFSKQLVDADFTTVISGSTYPGLGSSYTVEGPGFLLNSTDSATSCDVTLKPESKTFNYKAGSGSLKVTAASDCSWTAAGDEDWLTLKTGKESGTGNGKVVYTVSANTSSNQRTGTISVNGKSFNITQNGAACKYTISPASSKPAISVSGGTGTINVTATPDDCSWTSTVDSTKYPWITIDSGSSGTGNGTVGYTVAAKTTKSARSGKINIVGSDNKVKKTFTVKQAK